LRRTLQVVAGRVKATEFRFAEMCGVRVEGPRAQALRRADSRVLS
jgi:hypothetical protein